MSSIESAAAPLDLATDGSVRGRLLDAMLTCIGDRGYRDSTVADVVRVARTSRRTFYQEFDDKQDCFVELLRVANEATIRYIVDRIDAAAPWRTQIRQAVTAYAAINDSRRALTLSWIRDLPALGAAATPTSSAQQMKAEAMESWITLFTDITSTEVMRLFEVSRALLSSGIAGCWPAGRGCSGIVSGGVSFRCYESRRPRV